MNLSPLLRFECLVNVVIIQTKSDTRRSSLRTPSLVILLVLAVISTSALAVPSTDAPTILVQLVYVGDRDRAAFLGVSQGLAEANLQGRFLGQRYELRSLGKVEKLTAGVTAVLAAMNDEALIALAKQYPQVPVLNLASQSDGLRALCHPNLLHVVPSQSMKDDALAQWRTLNKDARVSVQAWHPSFTKYAAEQLSKRFFEAQGRIMDDEAWAGWAAVKLVSDTVARVRSAAPKEILAYLKGKITFDGQKGIDLSFRPNGQLRQPLWIVSTGKVIGEAPVKGVVEPEDLDSLGGSSCP